MLDVEQILEIKEVLIQNAEEILCDMNRQGTINSFLNITGLDYLLAEDERDANTQDKSGKIVIIGDSKISNKIIRGIFKDMGISPDRAILHTDYHKVQKLNYHDMQYNDNYALILFGPVGHSARDKGMYGSIITALEQEDGYPPVLRLGENKLKISKTGLKNALKTAITEGYIEQDLEIA